MCESVFVMYNVTFIYEINAFEAPFLQTLEIYSIIVINITSTIGLGLLWNAAANDHNPQQRITLNIRVSGCGIILPKCNHGLLGLPHKGPARYGTGDYLT